MDELEWRSDDQRVDLADAAPTAASGADGLNDQQPPRERYSRPDSLLDVRQAPVPSTSEEIPTIGAGAVTESLPVAGADTAAAPVRAVAAEFGGEDKADVATAGGGKGGDTTGVGEVSGSESEKDDAPPFLEQFEEVELEVRAKGSGGGGGGVA